MASDPFSKLIEQGFSAFSAPPSPPKNFLFFFRRRKLSTAKQKIIPGFANIILEFLHQQDARNIRRINKLFKKWIGSQRWTEDQIIPISRKGDINAYFICFPHAVAIDLSRYRDKSFTGLLHYLENLRLMKSINLSYFDPCITKGVDDKMIISLSTPSNTKLESLNLSLNSNIPSSIFPSISQCSQLKILDISASSVQFSSIREAEDCFRSIAAIPSLEKLLLQGWQLLDKSYWSAFHHLSSSKTLSWLNISDNDILSSDLYCIKDFPSLHTLIANLSDMNNEAIEGICQCTSLYRLDVGHSAYSLSVEAFQSIINNSNIHQLHFQYPYGASADFIREILSLLMKCERITIINDKGENELNLKALRNLPSDALESVLYNKRIIKGLNLRLGALKVENIEGLSKSLSVINGLEELDISYSFIAKKDILYSSLCLCLSLKILHIDLKELTPFFITCLLTMKLEQLILYTLRFSVFSLCSDRSPILSNEEWNSLINHSSLRLIRFLCGSNYLLHPMMSDVIKKQLITMMNEAGDGQPMIIIDRQIFEEDNANNLKNEVSSKCVIC